MQQILMLIDNLRIGGFQRLALDQAYALSECKVKVTFFVLDNTNDNKALQDLEKKIIELHKIDIYHVGGSRHFEIKQIRNFLKINTNTVILSHSLRGTIEAWIARKLSFRKNESIVLTTIHQLPTLSSNFQRFLRFTYAQFTDYLFAYSEAVKSDWITRIRKFPFVLRYFYSKRIEVLRNGIYLERLPSVAKTVNNSKPRLIYLGRLREWKGLSTYYSLASISQLAYFDFLMIIPELSADQKTSIEFFLGDRVQFIVGKTIANLEPRIGDVHIYPTNYGSDARFVESISLNCLEFACIGVPSIVSQDGLSTWKDLNSTFIFRQVDWQDINNVVDQITHSSRNQTWDLNFIRNSIDIRKNINAILKII